MGFHLMFLTEMPFNMWIEVTTLDDRTVRSLDTHILRNYVMYTTNWPPQQYNIAPPSLHTHI